MEASQNDRTIDWALAYGMLRLVLGLSLATHGINRILGAPAAFANALGPLFARTLPPPSSVYVYAITLAFVETLAGIFVLIGFASRYALGFGRLLIAFLTFGSTLRQDWQSAGSQLIYALLYALLFAARGYNLYSFDYVLGKKSSIRTTSTRYS
jgi:thiosulfate dehydrogenase (quinone) large subunit